MALAGHGEPVDDPAARAREIAAHHDERLEQTAARARAGTPQTPYEASLRRLPRSHCRPVVRRFALAETRAHLEYLVGRDRARRDDAGDVVVYEVA